jgi:thiamine biosynthesis protein ThiS
MITVGDQMQIPWRAGMTVQDLLGQVPEGHDCAAVRVNGRVVARPRFDDTPVPDGAQIYLVPMIVGG